MVVTTTLHASRAGQSKNAVAPSAIGPSVSQAVGVFLHRVAAGQPLLLRARTPDAKTRWLTEVRSPARVRIKIPRQRPWP